MDAPFFSKLTSLERGRLVIQDVVNTLPSVPGVYRMLNQKGEALYVGKAKDLKKRVTTYTQPDRLPLRLQRMISETYRMEIVTTHTEVEAFLLEANLIKKLFPRYNILFRDDKSLAYIGLTKHPFPLLKKCRGKPEKEAEYFGPFASVDAINKTLKVLHGAFLLRSCSDPVFKSRRRPCLQYHIKRCSAPCVGKIPLEAYQDLVKQAKDFLKGQSRDIQKTLAEEMLRSSEKKDYEKAGVLRDRIHALAQIQSQQSVYTGSLKDADIIALHQGEGRSCVQMFFFRNGSNYGTQAFFPTHDFHEKASDVLQAFLGQFYTDIPPPPLLLLTHELLEKDILVCALSKISKKAVKIEVPKRGQKKLIMDQALLNAQEALSRHLAQSESQQKILKRLGEVLGLPKTPERIEVYDNSHLQGTNAVGAMIVAGSQGFIKKAYRKFIIKTTEKSPDGERSRITPGDDLGMMREVLTRRFKRLLDHKVDCHREVWPDLIMIDGGRGQLFAAKAVFDELRIRNIFLLAIAKGVHRNAGHEVLYRLNDPPLRLDFRDPLLYYLQRLRDESHRYVISAHRQKRLKGLIYSGLEDVQGIGPDRKKALLRHFGSLESVKKAGVEDLKAVEGISLSIAQRIYDFFHPHHGGGPP